MNITSIVDLIKNFFISIVDKMKFLFENDKKRFFIIIGIFFVIIILLLILLFSPKKKKNTTIASNFSLSEDIVIPKSPEIKNDYSLTRETNDKWSKEEGEKYFTTPNNKEINSLSDSNDMLISNMIGAAP